MGVYVCAPTPPRPLALRNLICHTILAWLCNFSSICPQKWQPIWPPLSKVYHENEILVFLNHILYTLSPLQKNNMSYYFIPKWPPTWLPKLDVLFFTHANFAHITYDPKEYYVQLLFPKWPPTWPSKAKTSNTAVGPRCMSSLSNKHSYCSQLFPHRALPLSE